MSSSPLSAAKGFRLVASGIQTAADARHDEALLRAVEEYGPVADIWQTPRSLVVPRSYRRFEAFNAACEQFAARGWPVTVRLTGGGIVPQGPGILNLSLAYPVQGPPMQHSEAGYRLICGLLEAALRSLGVEAFPVAVEGSFCDGRYNLAVSQNGEAVKIAGTAQSWRRVAGSRDQHIGLVHGLILVDADSAVLTQAANDFEAAIGSARRYLPQKVTSLAQLLGPLPDLVSCFEQALLSALGDTSFNRRA